MSSSSTNGPRTKTGCQNCRLRHLKCDEQRPSYTRCEKAGIECIRGYNIRFRHGANPSVAKSTKGSSSTPKSEYNFGSSQQWVKTSRHLTFLDLTRELMSIYDHEPGVDNGFATQSLPWTETESTIPKSTPSEVDTRTSDSPAGPPPYPEHVDTTEHQSVDELGSPTKKRRSTFSSSHYASPATASPVDVVHHSPVNSWHHASPHTAWTPSATDIISETLNFDPSLAALEPTASHHSQPAFTAVSESLLRIYLDTPVWPLSDREEARLLRYYVEHIARSFDLTDPYRHFRTVVPQRAATCPTLLNAVFALSARHLSRIGEYDPLVSNKYHQECLKHLIPMLDDSAAILDENLLASTIILRHLEEIEVPLSGQSPSDQQSHLLGSHAFITAQERATVAGGLRQAAFWVGLRQEIHVAFVNQRSIIPALEHCNIDRSFEAAADHVWACRMVVLCADVLRYCFGDGDHSTATYTSLAKSMAQWYNCKPSSFMPVYYKEAEENNVFPDIWIVGDEILIGWQHYHIARILLSAHNPKMPRLGPSRAAALRTMDEEIKDSVRVLCGISLSNPSPAPNFTYSSTAVTMAGDKFTERHEQEALMNVLNICDKTQGWPTGHAQENLKDAWGWTESV